MHRGCESVPEPEPLVMLSALQHYLFCPRQCALIHMDQEWAENVFTAEGRILHEKADSGKHERRKDVRTETGVLLRSRRLGLTGKADVVEFRREERRWIPFPVEYKRGRPKSMDADRIQLCAQALCLEEMTGLPVPEGALFYGKTRRREAVAFDDALRAATFAAVSAVRLLLEKDRLPPPLEEVSGCGQCSLRGICLPELAVKKAASYLDTLCGEP